MGVFYLALLVAQCGPVALDKETGSWQTLTGSVVTVEYERGMENAAKQILPRLDDLFASGASDEDNLAKLARYQDEALQLIADDLALDKPTENMKKVFSQVLEQMQEMGLGMPDLRHLRLYSVEALDAALAGGPSVPGFVRSDDARARGNELIYEPPEITYSSDDHTIHYSVSVFSKVESGKGVSIRGKAFGHNILYPVAVRAMEDDVSRLDTEARLNRFLARAQLMQISPAGILIHETAELAILDAASGELFPFGRWFSEGAANCVASHCLEKFLGHEPGRQFLHMWEDLTTPEGRAQADLATWPFLGYEPAPSPELESAYYAVATEVVEKLIKDHGENVIQDVMQKLCVANKKQVVTLEKALKDVTGESTETLLPKPNGAGNPGVAAGNFSIGPFKKRLWRSPRLIREGTIVSARELKSGGLGVEFTVLCLNAPASVKVYLRAADTTEPIAKREATCPVTSAGIQCFLPLAKQRVNPGLYRLEIIVNETVCKAVAVEVVETNYSGVAPGMAGARGGA